MILIQFIPPTVLPNIPDPKVWLNRGYTGHEHLDEFVLVNMNNRMYDPIQGRMLAVDNYIADTHSTQAFNRYSYVLNNPLRYVDPTGEYGEDPPGSYSVNWNVNINSSGFDASVNISWNSSTGGPNNVVSSGSINVSLNFNNETGVFSGNVCVDGNVVSSTLGASSFSESEDWSYSSSDYLRATNWRQNSIDYNYAKERISHVLSPVQGDKYPGISVYESPLMDGHGVTIPPFGIIVGESAKTGIIQHEYGHYLQYKDIGILSYYIDVGLPSAYNMIENKVEIALYGKTMFSVQHHYFGPETDANSRSQDFFGPSEIDRWPNSSKTIPSLYTWDQRIQGITLEAICPNCIH